MKAKDLIKLLEAVDGNTEVMIPSGADDFSVQFYGEDEYKTVDSFSTKKGRIILE